MDHLPYQIYVPRVLSLLLELSQEAAGDAVGSAVGRSLVLEGGKTATGERKGKAVATVGRRTNMFVWHKRTDL